MRAGAGVGRAEALRRDADVLDRAALIVRREARRPGALSVRVLCRMLEVAAGRLRETAWTEQRLGA